MIRIHRFFLAGLSLVAFALLQCRVVSAQQAALSVAQFDALCSTTAAPSGEELRLSQDATGLDAGFSNAVAAVTNAANLGACEKALRTLDESFVAPLLTNAQSLCDVRAARGAGSSGETLSRETRDVSDALRNAARSPKNLDECKRAGNEIENRMAQFRVAREHACADEGTAPRKCGTLARDPAMRSAAKLVCDAYLADRLMPEAARTTVASCLQKNAVVARAREIGARSPGEASSEAGTRALGGAALQTAILEGVANFFVERAEQELSLFTADLVASRLCENTIKPFLPNTCALLKPDSDGPVLGATPLALRESVRADLEALPVAVATKAGTKDPRLGCGVAFGWGFAAQAIAGVDVVTLLTNPNRMLAVSPASAACDDTMKREIRDLAAELKKVLETGKFEVPGLVREGRFTNVIDVSGASKNLINPATGTLEKLGALAREVLARVQELDRAIEAWKKTPTATTKAAVVAAGIRAVEPVLVYLVPKQEQEIRASVKLGVQLANREYAAAIITFSTMSVIPAKGHVRNVLTLAASLAQAESADGVQASMKAAALPLGSWRRKNEPEWGATLTGVVGFAWAKESVLKNTADGSDVQSGATIAPSLLVGFDLHHGISKAARFGLNLSILDLGALGTIRLNNPKVERAAPGAEAERGPEVRFEQVFAPTLFPYLGLGPFDLGPVIGYVPSLRAVNTPGASTEMLDVWRVGMLLGVDVSVLPLF